MCAVRIKGTFSWRVSVACRSTSQGVNTDAKRRYAMYRATLSVPIMLNIAKPANLGETDTGTQGLQILNIKVHPHEE